MATWEGAALRDWKVHPQKGQTLAKLLAVVEGLLQCTCTYYEYKVQLIVSCKKIRPVDFQTDVPTIYLN